MAPGTGRNTTGAAGGVAGANRKNKITKYLWRLYHEKILWTFHNRRRQELKRLRDNLPQLHGRGISYDEKRNTYTVTLRAYEKLKEQYRIRYETRLD